MASGAKLPEPWTIEGNPWGTEAKFLAWVRGVLRKGWSRHPIKILFLQSVRERVKNTNPRSMKRFPETWGCRCSLCNEMHPQANIEVDHIEAAGGFKTIQELGEWAAKLFLVDFKSIRAVCKPCHKVKSYAERMGFTFEEAKGVKAAIEFCKRPKAEVLAMLSDNGYNGASVATAAKRKELVTKIMMGGGNG